MLLYDKNAIACNRATAKNYSSSFSIGIRLLKKEYRYAIYSLYGYMRIADEVCHLSKNNKLEALNKFKEETFIAIDNKYSSNPIVHGFQNTVNRYKISKHLIEAFLYALELDLTKKELTPYEFELYVYGCSEVIGVMCLRIFYADDDETYNRLLYPARKLGQAFRHVTLLRDFKENHKQKGKVYFPGLTLEDFTEEKKKEIDNRIQQDFAEAFNGILLLKKEIRIGVLVSYSYFVDMLKTLRNLKPEEVLKQRHNLSLFRKVYLLIRNAWVLAFHYYKKPRKLNLTSKIDDNSGFCFGVVNAVEKAEEVLSNGETLYCVGEIMHNEEEIHRLESKGMITISKDQLHKYSDKKILFRAHGEPPESFELARRQNHNIIDASCPIVIGVQNKVKLAHKRGEHVVIFGKKNHAEVIGLNGQIDYKADVVLTEEDIDKANLPNEITLFSQTTMDPAKFDALKSYIEKKGIKVLEKNTICKSVLNRRKGIESFCKSYDVILFMAGEHSSNGKVLYTACKNHNPRTHFITSPNKIYKKWFNEGEKVGICGATSTPKWLMQEAKRIVDAY